MTGTNIGIIAILVILVPVLFQVLLQNIKQEKRHREIIELLNRIIRDQNK
jgi:hypothetical protein